MFISGVNNTGDKLFNGANDIADKFLTEVTTPAINLCHRFSVIGGVVDTGDKFITGVTDTTEQLSPVTTTLAINLSPVSTMPLNRKAPEALTPAKNYRRCC
jgi:hypothetical protein